jgi:hypothetical protein
MLEDSSIGVLLLTAQGHHKVGPSQGRGGAVSHCGVW